MDQGVIRSLKAYYKSLSVRKLIEAIDKNKPRPEFSILDAMRMLDVAWGKVTKKTVVNCFAKAGISKEKQVESLSEADDPFKDLQEQLDKLAVHAPEFFPEGTTAADVVSADDSVINTEPVMTDDEILFDMLVQDDMRRKKATMILHIFNQVVPSLMKFVEHWRSCVSICSSVKMVNVYTNVSIK